MKGEEGESVKTPTSVCEKRSESKRRRKGGREKRREWEMMELCSEKGICEISEKNEGRKKERGENKTKK